MPRVGRNSSIKPARRLDNTHVQFEADFRNAPLQARSRRTLQKIIDATCRLLHRTTPAEITTDLIAREAKIAVGSIYRFFPDKQTIFDAIGTHHMAIFRDRLQDLYDRSSAMDGSSFISAMTDLWVELFDSRKDIQAISFLEANPKLNVTGTPFLKRFLVERLGWGNTSELDMKLRIRVELSVRLLSYAYSQPTAAERKRVITELKRILCGYFFPDARL